MQHLLILHLHASLRSSFRSGRELIRQDSANHLFHKIHILRLFGWPRAPEGDFRAQGKLVWLDAGLALDGMRLEIAADELQLDGTIARPASAAGTSLRLLLKGASRVRIGERLGVAGLPDGAYRIAGRLRRQRAATVRDGFQATLAGATLQLDGALGDAPAFAGTRLKFNLQGQALERFAALLGDYVPPRGAFRADGTLERTGAHIRLRDGQADHLVRP